MRSTGLAWLVLASVVAAKNLGGLDATAAVAVAATSPDSVVAGSLLPQLAKTEHVASANGLRVNPIDEADNTPTPADAKLPLDPHGVGAGRHVAMPASEPPVPVLRWHELVMPILMIVVLEIGDKTFLIAALMAMKHLRWVVFTAAFLSLAIMTVLLGVIGHAVPALILQRVTQFLALGLFLVFGYKLAREGLAMPKDLGVEEEMAEVEEELATLDLNANMNDIEMGSKPEPLDAGARPLAAHLRAFAHSFGNLAALVLLPTWILVFVMTFLGEWGDRSQIAIIAMAAVPDYWVVILGAVIGHGFCTATACVGGKLLAKRISLRNVTLGGAAAFVVFAVMYFYDAINSIE